MRRLLLALTLALAGCPDAAPPATSTSAGAELTAEESARVSLACARCHLLPPPDSLPRRRWREVIPAMVGIDHEGPEAPLDPADAALALRHYERLAPDELPDAPQSPALDATLAWRIESFTPKGVDRKIPAVAHVTFTSLNAPPRLDLLVSEMRSRRALLLAPWAAPEQRKLVSLGAELGYPSHCEAVDVDRDGDLDLVVAGLGGMNPSNAEQGLVAVLRQDAEHRFQAEVVAKDLGRVASVRAADMDGDGDLDLVAAVFGWRGPGQLLLLERVTAAGPQVPGAGAGAGAPLRFEPRVLDRRDGWIDAHPLDLDGDGRLDLITLLSQEHEQVLWLKNTADPAGKPAFVTHVLFRAPHPAWGMSSLEVHDLDQDGDRDLLVTNGDTLDDNLLKPYHGAMWLEATGGDRYVPHPIGALYGCERATAGDLDGDGDQDVVAVAFLPQVPPETQAARDLDSIVWFERTGPDAWTRRALEKRRALHPTVALGDHDHDGRLDIAVGNFVWMLEEGKPMLESEWVTVLTQVKR